MRDRIDIFRQEFLEFKNLDEEHIRTLVYIYDKNIDAKYNMSDPAISTVGGLLLWVGWLFFNSASGYEAVDLTVDSIPTRITINTIVSGSAAGIFYSLITYLGISHTDRMRVRGAGGIMNAILSGLVAITSACNNVSLTASAIIGIVGAIAYMVSTRFLIKWKIDDPIEAS